MSNAVELVSFQLKNSVEETSFLISSKNFQEHFVAAQSGFISRKLVKSEDGLWADMVIWSNMDSAQQAAQNMQNSPFAGEYVSMIEESSITMQHFTVIQAY